MSETKKIVKRTPKPSTKEVGFREWLAAYNKVNSFNKNFEKEKITKAAKELEKLEQEILKQL